MTKRITPPLADRPATLASERFRHALRAARKAAGLTQAAAADRLGIAQPLWSAYERGVQQPTLDQAARLARIVRKPLKSLL